jgi:hypothetical protein
LIEARRTFIGQRGRANVSASRDLRGKIAARAARGRSGAHGFAGVAAADHAARIRAAGGGRTVLGARDCRTVRGSIRGAILSSDAVVEVEIIGIVYIADAAERVIVARETEIAVIGDGQMKDAPVRAGRVMAGDQVFFGVVDVVVIERRERVLRFEQRSIGDILAARVRAVCVLLRILHIPADEGAGIGVLALDISRQQKVSLLVN